MDRFACTKHHSTCSTHPNSLTAPCPHEVGATFIPITQMRTPRSTAAASSGVPAILWQSPALPHYPTLLLKLPQKSPEPSSCSLKQTPSSISVLLKQRNLPPAAAL